MCVCVVVHEKKIIKKKRRARFQIICYDDVAGIGNWNAQNIDVGDVRIFEDILRIKGRLRRGRMWTGYGRQCREEIQ